MDSLGPFFALDTWRPDSGWLPLTALIAPAVLHERVEVARAVLARRSGISPAAIEARVAASIVFLGLSARLTSPALGAAVLTGEFPALSVGSLWWRPVSGGPWPMAATPVPSVRADPTTLVQTIAAGVVAPLLAAFAAEFRLSRIVLWGNAASALGGAVAMLATARPDRAVHAAELVAAMLQLPPLRGTGAFVGDRFVRRSCCLFYRIPGAGRCGDCILATASS